jgi:hypothetical protein
MGVVTPTFKRSSILKNNKISDNRPLYTFPILGARGIGLGQPASRPEMHPVVPRGLDQKPWFIFCPAFRNYPSCNSFH